MLFFRRSTAHGSASNDLQRARACHPSAGSSRSRDGGRATSTALGTDDWSKIRDLLLNASGESLAQTAESPLGALRRTSVEIRSFVRGERTVGATHARDWLLDLWEAAHGIGPGVAAPVESLLTRMVAREVVSAEEIVETCNLTERAALALGRTASHARLISPPATSQDVGP